MSLDTTATTSTRNPLAPITLEEVLALATALQPEATETSLVPELLTPDALANQEYEEYLDDRLSRYGY